MTGRDATRCCNGADEVGDCCHHCAWHHGRPPEDFRKGACVVWNCPCIGYLPPAEGRKATPLLCRIGWHRWERTLSRTGMVVSRRCVRCPR